MAESNPVLDIIVNAGKNAVASARQVAVAEQAAAAETQKIVGEAIATNKQIAGNQQIVTAAQRGGELAAQEQMLALISGAQGIETLGALLKKSTQTANEVVALTEAVRKEQDVRLVDDPLTWIKAQVDWNKNQDKLLNATDQLRIVSSAAQQVAGQVTQVGQISKATARTITQASAQAEIDNVALIALQQQRELQLKGLAANIQGVRAAAEADDKTLTIANQVGTFARMEQQFQLALEEFNQRKTEFEWRKSEKEDQRGFEERTIAAYNAGRVARGQQPVSALEVRDMLKLGGNQVKGEMAEVIELGRIALQTGQALIATDPGKVAGLLKNSPELVASLDETQKKVAGVLLEAYKVLGDKAVRAKEGLDDDKNGAKAQRVVGKKAQELVNAQLQFVGNNPDNIFFIGDLTSFIGSAQSPGIAAFQSYPLTQKVLNPAIKAGVALSDPTVPFKLTLEAIKRGEISTAQAAADFSNIYRRASMVHRAAADFRKFAITLPPEGSQYKVKLDGEVVDVTNYQQVATVMSKALRTAEINKKLNDKQIPVGFLGRMNK